MSILLSFLLQEGTAQIGRVLDNEMLGNHKIVKQLNFARRFHSDKNITKKIICVYLVSNEILQRAFDWLQLSTSQSQYNIIHQ